MESTPSADTRAGGEDEVGDGRAGGEALDDPVAVRRAVVYQVGHDVGRVLGGVGGVADDVRGPGCVLDEYLTLLQVRPRIERVQGDGLLVAREVLVDRDDAADEKWLDQPWTLARRTVDWIAASSRAGSARLRETEKERAPWRLIPTFAAACRSSSSWRTV